MDMSLAYPLDSEIQTHIQEVGNCMKVSQAQRLAADVHEACFALNQAEEPKKVTERKDIIDQLTKVVSPLGTHAGNLSEEQTLTIKQSFTT
eukprot:6005383-Amphidinium_carterae.1